METTARLFTAVSSPSSGEASISTMFGPACGIGIGALMVLPGVTVRPLRHIGGEFDFNEVFLDAVRVPDTQRVGAVGEGWRVAGATLAGERQMVSGSGSGGVDRIGGSGVERVVRRARELGKTADPHVRQRLAALISEERIRGWTNQRVRAAVRAGAGAIGPHHLLRLETESARTETRAFQFRRALGRTHSH